MNIFTFMKDIYKLNKIILGLLGLVVMLSALVVIASALNNRPNLNGRVFGSGTLTFVPTETAESNKSEWTVVVKASTSEKITGALVNVTYDKSKISVVSALIDPRFNCMSLATADQTNGSINISGFVTDVCDVQAGTTPLIDAKKLPTGEVVLGSFVFRGLTAGTVSLGFASTTEVDGYNPNSADVVINVTKTPVTVRINPY
jgi:hypothetical protein